MSLSSQTGKLKALIVDDELHGRENLKKIIGNYCPEVEVHGTAENVTAAKGLVVLLKPEVVFLDINMPVLDGFDFLDQFDERDFMVVFVSAHEEYGIKALKAGAVDYLLKPINIKELKLTVKKLLSLQDSSNNEKVTLDSDKVIIPDSNGFNVIETGKIIRLEADGCYTKIFTSEGKNSVISRTLKDFENSLPENTFFRIHKSHLINFKFIKSYSNLDGTHVIMNDGSRIEISRRKAPDFLQRIKTLINVV